MQLEQVERARAGDRVAFDALTGPELGRLRGFLRRMLAHPDDAADVLQEVLVKAWQSIGTFRGEARFGTWLHAIAARQAVDFLRARRRYRAGAQLYAQDECVKNGSVAEVIAALGAPDFQFDVHEHVAYCFACVGRSLEPEQQAALVLRDVYGYSNDEAAAALGLTSSVLRHSLSDARETMMARYDGLCALVSKTGVCYQCEGLREGAPAAHRGVPPRSALPGSAETRDERWKRRLAIVRDADVVGGHTRALHDVLARQVGALEQARAEEDSDIDVMPTPSTSCAPASAGG